MACARDLNHACARRPPLHRCLAALLLCCSAGACKGCDGEAPVVERAAQDEEVARRSRLAQRALPRDKTYPKADDGSVSCGDDIDCFLLQAQECTAATVRHRQTHSYLGLTQVIAADYRIVSPAGHRCVLTRQVLELGATLSDAMARAMMGAGKTADEVQDIRDGAQFRLRESFPPKVECRLEHGALIDLLLAVAEGKYTPYPWRKQCREVASNVVPIEPDQRLLVEALADEDAAAPESATVRSANAPAPKQPR